MDKDILGKEISVHADVSSLDNKEEDMMDTIRLNVSHFQHRLVLRVRPDTKRAEVMEQAIQRYGMALRGRQFCLVDKYGKQHFWTDETDSFVAFLIKIRQQVQDLPRTTSRLVLFAYAKYFKYGFMSIRIPIRIMFENRAITLPEKIAVTRKVRVIKLAAALALEFKNADELQLLSDKKVLDDNSWIVDTIHMDQNKPIRAVVRKKLPGSFAKKPVAQKTLSKWYSELEELSGEMKNALSVAAENNSLETGVEANDELQAVIDKYESRAWAMYQRVQSSLDNYPAHPNRNEWDAFLVRLKPFGYASTQDFVEYMKNKNKQK